MNQKMPVADPGHVASAVMRIMAPLARWLLRSGIGYTDFAASLKTVFLNEARLEARRGGGKETDSALSLLAGLHRKDIRRITQTADSELPRGAGTGPARAGLPSQVVTRWVATGLPDSLPLSGDNSFENLARSVSVDVHPYSIQQELVRLGIASVQDGSIRLARRAFIADPATRESQQLMADGVADHLAAGVHNLTSGVSRQYLEQAVFADGLSAESVRQLEQLANQLWQESLARMVAAAVPLCEHDEPLGGDQRIRLGMFCYSEPLPRTAAIEETNP